MGHGFNRQWAGSGEAPKFMHGGGRGRRGGPWAHLGHQGPPPWVAGLFGLDEPGQRRGPRARRGDVRAAILDVVATAARAEEEVNGYQVIQQITDRSAGAWRPSPGSVYPTVQQLQDEGLLEVDDERGRRSLRLTSAGQDYVAANADELAAVWAPFERREREAAEAPYGDLKPEIGQVMSAVWQIVTSGSESQKRAAVGVLVDTRRRLYGILADGDEAADEATDETAEGES
ncbi:PadR family transcriptional regulator [Nocardioides sp. SYSU D00038]|uniref:PadR family transcriptional regulator n=1 Tax=Nocardioides sp. SYSU D00038 TaxID=2812554 RepID=UPI001968391A|nr:PadR family transcriptional regulator [Nocardioides sp. SYSU D00038]